VLDRQYGRGNGVGDVHGGVRGGSVPIASMSSQSSGHAL
jgi:hypothetical protein